MPDEQSIQKAVEYAREVVGRDPWAVFLGIKVEEVREGYARCSLTIQPNYLNAVDRAHGAVIYALADQAFAVASNSTGEMAVALDFHISYIGPAPDGERIFSEAVPIQQGRKISVWRVEIRDSADVLIAAGQGTAYHK